MKRIHLLSALLFILMSVICMPLSAQGNSWHRNENRSNGNERKRESSRRHNDKDKRNDNYSNYRHNDHDHRTPHKYSRKEHRHQDGYAYRHEYQPTHHHAKHRRIERNYLRCLPAHHYTKVYLGGVAYYHCNGHLYTYHRGYGYLLADVQFQMVRHLPQHCDVRVYDGRRYYYKDGRCYLPQSDGHYRVFSLTVAL